MPLLKNADNRQPAYSHPQNKSYSVKIVILKNGIDQSIYNKLQGLKPLEMRSFLAEQFRQEMLHLTKAGQNNVATSHFPLTRLHLPSFAA